MSAKKEISEKKERTSFFDIFTEVMGWLQIAASPWLIGVGVAVFVYFPHPTTLNLVLAIGIALIGFITGILLATKIWKKKGTINFISSIMSAPEPDNPVRESE